MSSQNKESQEHGIRPEIAPHGARTTKFTHGADLAGVRPTGCHELLEGQVLSDQAVRTPGKKVLRPRLRVPYLLGEWLRVVAAAAPRLRVPYRMGEWLRVVSDPCPSEFSRGVVSERWTQMTASRESVRDVAFRCLLRFVFVCFRGSGLRIF